MDDGCVNRGHHLHVDFYAHFDSFANCLVFSNSKIRLTHEIDILDCLAWTRETVSRALIEVDKI